MGMGMSVELLHITPNALEFIGRCAGICYNSSQQSEACIKRAISCKDKGHLATLRFAHATFHVSGISRTCSHQFVRSKHLDFLQRSQRYCNEDNAMFILPSVDNTNYAPSYIQEHMANHFKKSLDLYNGLISLGVKKEDARFVLPEATQTELIVTGNLQAWLDFIKLRADKHAQWEIRDVAIEINNLLAKECPGLFEEMT